jgi:TRAP-type mannitol/chloroaromatic compound transport system permease small subunit
MILIPGIGASAEVLGKSESQLAIIFHAYQLIIFYILNNYTIQAEFTDKHMYAFILMIASVYIASRE